MKENFTNIVDSYWANKDKNLNFYCLSVSLFRLIGSFIGSLSNKQVLEVGPYMCADLIECRRCGADVVGIQNVVLL